MERYTPTAVGYECAAMLRYREFSLEESRIEIYPTSQWGLYGDCEGPESAVAAWAINPRGWRYRHAD
jgi:hypothetical protein